MSAFFEMAVHSVMILHKKSVAPPLFASLQSAASLERNPIGHGTDANPSRGSKAVA
jgi:hypothetical protein